MAPAKGKQTARTNPPEDSPNTGNHTEEMPPEEPTLLERIKTMSVDELIALLSEGELEDGSEEWRKVQHRVRQYEVMMGLEALRRKRGRTDHESDDPDTEETTQPRQKKTEVKYTNISKLTPQTTPRKFAEWKNDMKRLFRGAPENGRRATRRKKRPVMKLLAVLAVLEKQNAGEWKQELRETSLL